MSSDNNSLPAGPQPVSRLFGFDRGEPIDRYYMEKFLGANREAIRGVVLEIGDNAYTRKFGGRVERSEVLSYAPGDGVTIVGDLAAGRNIPENAFDCVIMTQTIQMIFRVEDALRNAWRALKPGGTLLVTGSGISQISRYDMDRWGEFWRFTDRSLRTLLEHAAPGAQISVQTFGNVAVAKAFLDGLALHELRRETLDYIDPDYQVIVAARADKTGSARKKENEFEGSGARSSPLILLYHRVAEDPVDAQLLCVSRENFAAHLQLLKQQFRVVGLHDLLQEASRGELRPNTVALTFDDGYLDVLTAAVPLLEKFQLPATIFITAGMIGTDREFWWDEVERVFLCTPHIPDVLEMKDLGLRLENLRHPGVRLKVVDEMVRIMKGMKPSDIDLVVNRLFAWVNLERAARKTHRIMNAGQLKIMASSPFVEIGSHTMTHSRLGILSPEQQRQELVESRKKLGEITGRPVRYLSYPFGGPNDFTEETTRLAAAAGYEAGIANIPGELAAPLNRFAVPRRLVRNWRGETMAAWLTAADKERLENETLQERQKRLG
ncbi:MAG: polysaccharide deacetylase family protein [Verrucomicrobiae bacterium]|nr:polysaccharide deacetylase family protein [Verrucomicrobiae bacterium]